MSQAQFNVGIPGLSGVFPSLAFLDTSESYNEIIQPGYLNQVMKSGVFLDNKYLVLANYGVQSQTQIFNVVVSEGVYSLETYSPNDNSFSYTETQFVSKGGSDLNPGNTLGLPKLTIPAAITALNLSPSMRGLVVVLDGGSYTDNVTLPFNITLWMPSANIETSSGNSLFVVDTGLQTLGQVTANGIFANGSGSHAIAVSGANSSLFVNAQILQGNIYNEGGLTLTAIALVESAVHITSTGRWAPDIRTVIGLYTPIFDVGSIVKGNIGDISNGNTIYGAQNFLDKVVTHLIPSDEVVGRPLVAEDVGKFISYNAVTDGLYTLPVTADADISPGTTIPFYQYGSGKISFTAGAGATVQSLVGTAMRTNGAFAKAEVNKQSDTLWVVTGNIEIAP